MSNMFCFQCEQTIGCSGCTGNSGVCGKTADTAKLQDELTGALIGLARAVGGAETISQSTGQVIIEGLFTTVTNVSFDDAAFGCEKMIHLKDENGQVQSLKVTIPAGIDTGKTVRLKGKGNPGFNGGESGDLLLKVKVGGRAGFERKGMDVYTNISIPFTTAVLGGEAVVPTLNGNVICKIRPGTQSGSKIRLKGKGIVSMKDRSVHGDEYAVVQIQVPKNLNETAKEKLKEFAKAC